MECLPRFGTKRSPERATLGPAVGIVAALLGKPLMAWQQHVANVILEIDPDTGRLAYDEWCLTVPRQSGKSTFILAKSTHRASATKFFGGRQRLVYTAQTRAKAREKWEEDYLADLQGSAKFKHKVTGHLGNGNEHMRFPNGSRFGIEANTEKAGHGGTLDEAYIDEAFAQVDNRLEQAFGPAMITRANKQLGIISTAGWSDASPYLLEKVRVGRALAEQDVRRGTAYFEWSAPDGADPSDESLWYEVMPALHRPDCPPSCTSHTVTIEAIRNEYAKAFRSGKISDFCRAYLNMWLPKPREGEETVLGNWTGCRDKVTPFPVKPGAIGMALSPDESHVSIGVGAVLEDGRAFVAPAYQLTTEEAISAAARIQRTHGCALVVDGPGAVLIKGLEDEGCTVTKTNLEQCATACFDARERVKNRTLIHPGDTDLDAQVEDARWREAGGKKLLGRKESAGDISMLEAVVLALWGATSAESYDVMSSFLPAESYTPGGAR